MSRCPGMYCGRTVLDNGTLSDCAACPRGFRSNSSSICELCKDNPIFYDWLYMGFIVITVCVLHLFCIDTTVRKKGFVLHISAIFETITAAVLTVLVVDPFGEFGVRSCHTHHLSDWYTLFHNPSPQYEKTLHCTQEAVYPLYTMVFMFYAIAVSLMLLIRPWIAGKFLPLSGKLSIYAALYFFPLLSLIHAAFGGLIYFSFPYIIIILSIVSNAAHFALELDQSMSALVMNTITDTANIVTVLVHWALNAYGIISITQLTEPLTHSLLILLVPAPTIFYILTARFTDPKKLHAD